MCHDIVVGTEVKNADKQIAHEAMKFIAAGITGLGQYGQVQAVERKFASEYNRYGQSERQATIGLDGGQFKGYGIFAFVQADGALVVDSEAYVGYNGDAGFNQRKLVTDRIQQAYIGAAIQKAFNDEGFDVQWVFDPSIEVADEEGKVAPRGSYVLEGYSALLNGRMKAIVHGNNTFNIDFLEGLEEECVWLDGGLYQRIEDNLSKIGLKSTVLKAEWNEQKARAGVEAAQRRMQAQGF